MPTSRESELIAANPASGPAPGRTTRIPRPDPAAQTERQNRRSRHPVHVEAASTVAPQVDRGSEQASVTEWVGVEESAFRAVVLDPGFRGLVCLRGRVAVVGRKKPRAERAHTQQHKNDVEFLHRHVKVEVIAEALDRTPKHIYDLIKTGRLSALRDGRGIRVDLAEAKRYMESIKDPTA